MCESGEMAQTVNIILHAEDRERLLAIIGDRNRPLKHVQRAKIVLLSAERLPVLEVARRAIVSRPPSGVGSKDMASKASMDFCATRRANPVEPRFRLGPSRKCWN
jgi:hypothetical protein